MTKNYKKLRDMHYVVKNCLNRSVFFELQKNQLKIKFINRLKFNNQIKTKTNNQYLIYKIIISGIMISYHLSK